MAGGAAGAVVGRGGQMKLLVVRRYGVTVINALLDFRLRVPPWHFHFQAAVLTVFMKP